MEWEGKHMLNNAYQAKHTRESSQKNDIVWWFVSCLQGPFFWLSHAVIAVCLVTAAFLLWFDYHPTGLCKLPIVLGVLTLGIAPIFAMAGWILRTLK